VALGQTHYSWHPEVARRVESTLRLHPFVSANTYENHPWPGWDAFSADFWGPGGRGAPLNRTTGRRLWRYFLSIAHEESIRHIIYRHRLWTSFGGESYWPSNDHSGRLRHVHVTWWPAPMGVVL
jgi:hypothetical protein